MSETTDEPANVPEQAYAAIRGAEQRLADSFAADVGHELEIADRAVAFLLVVMSTVGTRTGQVQLDKEGNVASGDLQLLRCLRSRSWARGGYV